MEVPDLLESNDYYNNERQQTTSYFNKKFAYF